MGKIQKLSLFEKLLPVAPIAVWFSYRPLFTFGQNTSTNFEVSPTLIYVLLLALSALPIVWRSRNQLIGNKAAQLVAAFTLVSGLSIVLSQDVTRGILTFGVIGLLSVIFLACISSAEKLKKMAPSLVRIYIVSAVAMSLLAFIQVFAGIWLDRYQALLCAGCAPIQFGFARPNVFAIEPQFFGSLLLAPAIILFHRLLTKKPDIKEYKVYKEFIALVIILTALFLTLSRGAIFAFAISAGLIIVWELAKKRDYLSTVWLASLPILVGFVFCLLVQGTAAVLNPKVDKSFKGAAFTSINQLSLGVIDLQVEQTNVTSPTKTTDPEAPSAAKPASIGSSSSKVAPNFDGYVEESTNVRLKLSKLAVQSWKKTPSRMLFGVGLGGSGAALLRDFPAQVNPREIVQNEYAEILLENGLLGIGLFATLIGGLLYRLRSKPWAVAIVVAFLVQWNFFSGYPNALHIYLILMVLFIVSVRKSSSKL